MSKTMDLRQCNAEEWQDFLESFDIILSDCDGVLWHIDTPIAGALESLRKLQALGKKVYMVTNNSAMSIEHHREKARMNGLDVNSEQIINASKVVAWYLRKIHFHDEAFVIGSVPFKDVLREAGIKLTDAKPEVIETDVTATIRSVQGVPSVKAVIADFDIYCNWAKLTFAISCLQRKDVLYLSGALDEWVVYGKDKRILGPGPLVNVISTMSGREPTMCAKPSELLRDYILDVCKVSDPKRCLFIGDTINMDMKFGTMCGFLKLFVETGCDKLNDAQKSKDTCPDYYLPSLGELCWILDEFPHERSTNGTNNTCDH